MSGRTSNMGSARARNNAHCAGNRRSGRASVSARLRIVKALSETEIGHYVSIVGIEQKHAESETAIYLITITENRKPTTVNRQPKKQISHFVRNDGGVLEMTEGVLEMTEGVLEMTGMREMTGVREMTGAFEMTVMA